MKKIRETERDRVIQAYKHMAARANYRPAAPGDGLGGIDLTAEELDDSFLLDREAQQYAALFIKEEDSCVFNIGISNFSTNIALVYLIEAARVLCSGMNDTLAVKLIRMADQELAKRYIRGASA